MPRYNYICETCKIEDYLSSSVDGLSIFVDPESKDQMKEPLVWEEMHGMTENPEVKCHICDTICERTFFGVMTSFIIPGNFTRNTWECKTLSNIDKLQNNDPYAHCRESGDADDKISKFKKQMRIKSNWKADKYKETQKKKKRAKKKVSIDLSKKGKTTIQ